MHTGVISLLFPVLLLSVAQSVVHRLPVVHHHVGNVTRHPPYAHRVRNSVRGFYATISAKKTVHDYLESALLCDFVVGSPGVIFNLNMDVRSRKSWLLSETMSVPSRTGYVRQTYLPGNSTTFHNASRKFMTEDVKGWEAEDVWSIRDTNLTVVQNFGVVTSVSFLVLTDYAYKPADGVVGLDPGKDSDSFLHLLRPHLHRPFVSVWLSDSRSLEMSKTGIITLGDFDAQNCVFSSSLNVTKKPKGTWAFHLSHLSVTGANGKPETVVVNSTAEISFSAVGVYGTAEGIGKIAAILNATAYRDGYYTVPCSVRGTGPPVGFHIGDGMMYMSAEDYVFQVDGIPDCMLAFAAIEDAHTWTVGSRFMNSHCCFLDYGDDVLGFAKARK